MVISGGLSFTGNNVFVLECTIAGMEILPNTDMEVNPNAPLSLRFIF